MMKEKDYVDEQVYILSRMGCEEEALDLILSRQKNIPNAVAFIVERLNEKGLWDYLIGKIMKSSPDTIGALLENLEMHSDPVSVIQMIPPGTVIENMRDKLSTIIEGYNTQRSLTEGCSLVLKNDCIQLHRTFVSRRCEGYECSFYEKKCSDCDKRLGVPIGAEEGMY